MSLRLALTVLGLTSAVSACGSGGDTAPGTFNVDFPTTAAAVALVKSKSSVQISAYKTNAVGPGDASSAGACQTLVEDNLAGMKVAGSPVTTTSATPCQLLAGGASLAVPYGDYAFLAIAQTGGKDFLIGCAEQTISSTNTVVTIPLTLASASMAVPETSCTTVMQACANPSGC